MPKKKKQKYQKKKKHHKNKRKRIHHKKSSTNISASNLHKSSNNDFFRSKSSSKPDTIFMYNDNIFTSDPSLIRSSKRVPLDATKPFGEYTTMTSLNIPIKRSKNRVISNPLEKERQQKEYQEFMAGIKEDLLKIEKENRSSQNSDLDYLNTECHSFWNLFPYKYRVNVSGQCNYYFIRGNYLNSVAAFREKTGKSSFNSWELLKGLTLKEFRILIEENIPNAINECKELTNLFENAQFGDAVDIDGYRGHGLYILGFGDLSFSEIKNAYTTNSENDYLKLMKTFDYNSDHWRTFPMEFGDAPYNYYLNTPLNENNFRWVDPRRIAHKGVIWKKCMIYINKQKNTNYMDDKKEYVWINWGDCDEPELKTKDSLLCFEEAGITSYCNRYDEAVRYRLARFIKCLQTLCPLDELMIETILSFCV